MSHPAKSVFVHGLYLGISGLGLIFIPNIILGLLGISPTQEVWIRLVGVLTLILAFYFVRSARTENLEFVRWTILARISFFMFCAVFVLLGFIGPILLLFGGLDLFGAFWTIWALRTSTESISGSGGSM